LNQYLEHTKAALETLAMSRSCCKEFPRIFNGRQSLAAAPRDMECDMPAALSGWRRFLRRRPKQLGTVGWALIVANEISGCVFAWFFLRA
jgi:hypothetical protein